MASRPHRGSRRAWYAVALLAGAAAFLPRLPTATAMAVVVPPSQTGYSQIATTGALLYAVYHTIGPDGGTLGSTVWLVGPAGGRTTRIRFGSGGWIPCTTGAHLSQPAKLAGGITSYLCAGAGQGQPRSTVLSIQVLS